MKSRSRGTESDTPSANRTELARHIAHHCPQDGIVEAAPGLAVYRSSTPYGPIHRLSEASFCVIAQGAKEVLLGKERYRYGPSEYLLVTAGLPLVSHITDASRDRPFLGMRVLLDPAVITAVLLEAGHIASRVANPTRAVTISRLDPLLLSAVVRLVRLLDTPDDYKVLGPLIVREIVYRLLLGKQHGRLCQIADFGAAERRMSAAIGLIRKSYNKPLYIARLAEKLGMSSSTCHHHFKSATAMSPLRYQKQIRLQEARRLLVADSYDAATAAYRVGYDDPSQFTREYKRLFGEPPIRDVERMRSPMRVRLNA